MEFSGLEAEWHPTLNLPSLYTDSLPLNSVKYWWIGRCGHEWEATLPNRKTGRGCPICSGLRLLTAFNDLATMNPVIATEWHPTKNGKLTPQQVKGGSSEKVWWLGSQCKHEWKAQISSRMRKNFGCPICANRYAVQGVNDLATVKPELAAEWHPTKNGTLTPQQVTVGTSVKAWWLGRCSHEWEATAASRNRGSGCPFCSGQKVLIGFNDLCTTHPEIAAEWHPSLNGELAPQQVTSGSGRIKIWWLGKCGHEWEAKVSSRTFFKSGCPFCSGLKTLAGFNDLASQNPVLASEWHPTKNGNLQPDAISSGSNKRAWWLGECGHEWQSSIVSRNNFSSKCLICSNQKLLTGFNDLATTNPDLASEWHPTKNKLLKSNEVSAGTNKKAWWRGECGHEWEAVISSRASGVNCPYCAGQKILAGFNDLASRFPDVAAEWHPTLNGNLTAEDVSAGTTKNVWWLGKCGHEWKNAPSNRTAKQQGCSVCIGRTVLIGFNDLGSQYPEISAEWHPTKNGILVPEQVFRGSYKKVWWQCERNHEWENTIAHRTTRSQSCPQCWSKRFVSNAEQEIYEFVCGLAKNVTIIQSDKKILKGQELDIYIPEMKFAIEFNGIHWHKEKFKGKDAHYNKWLTCKDQGIQLMQIWEDDWNLRYEIIKKELARRLAPQLTQTASSVVQLSEQQANDFLTENHLLGGGISGDVCLGLMQSGDRDLQEVMVLLDGNTEMNIVRFASKENVSSDFSALLAYAIKTYNPATVAGMADNCGLDGKIYASNGFTVIDEIPVDYMYALRYERKPRSEYPLERFRNDPKLLWEEGLTEMELADLNGLDRIWDAGKTHYRLIL